MDIPEPNGLIFRRRFSQAYEQPTIRNTAKGSVVVRVDGETSNTPPSKPSDKMNPGLEILGGILARVTLGVFTVLGVLVGVSDKASIDVVSQFIGFMLMFMVTFMACTGTFYWWASISRACVKLTIKNVLYIYGVCVLSDFLARTINVFSRMPQSSAIPEDASYFVCHATILMFSFSLLFHKNGLNAMFSRETVLFVVVSVALNYSSSRLFSEVLPKIILPQMVHAGALMGLALLFADYNFPRMSPSDIYWMFQQIKRGRAQITPTLPEISVDYSPQTVSRRVSSASTARLSITSLSSSLNSSFPQAVDGDMVSEAHGLITDLLLGEGTLSRETHQKLRMIKEILAPRFEKTPAHPHIIFGSSASASVDGDDHECESDVSSLASSAISKRSHSHLSVLRNPRRQRSASVVHSRRRSTTKFSTVTTASGLPVLENEPLDRTRSVALRDVKARISVQERRYSVHKMGRERLDSGGGMIGLLERPNIKPPNFDTESDLEPLSNQTHSIQLPQISEGLDSSAPEDCGVKASNLEIITEGLEPDDLVRQSRSTMPGGLNLGVITEGEEVSGVENASDSDKSQSMVAFQEEEKKEKKAELFEQGVHQEHKFYSFTRYKRPSESCELTDYTSNDHLDMFENVAIWDYPIFELESKAGNHILSHMAHMLFHEAGLMETFQIPQREFVNYFRALEANYGSNVYHNKTHAADVLHAVSYLMFEIIPEFSHEYSYADDNITREWKGYSRTTGSGGNIASAFSILEVLACYMASAMHDFDHPGRTNAFLVSTKSQLALLYNDRSVLENHHAAASWHLLNNFPENNFVVGLEPAEMKRLRFLIIEAILATDLKMHFDLLAVFRAKVNIEDGGGIDWESEMDRLLVMQMMIKMADINTPTKSFELHRLWSKRITEEFYQQSEEEELLGLPATIFMDRKHPEKLPAIQISFIQHLVSPLFQACAEAGIIPGILEPVAPPTRDSTPPVNTGELPGSEMETDLDGGAMRSEGEASQSSSSLQLDPERDETFSVNTEAGQEPEAKFMSIILTNLQVNYEGWKAELPKEEDEEEKDEVNDDKENSDFERDLSPSSNKADANAHHEDAIIETRHDTSV